MIVNVTASICFLIVLLILIFDFFSKKTLSNLDNNSFKHLSVVCAFGLLIEFLTYLLVIFKFEIHSLPMMVLARFIFIYYLIFMYYFIIYVFCVCKKIQSRNEQYDRFKKVLLVLYIIFGALVILLPFDFSESTDYLYPVGLATNISYIIGGLGVLFILIICIINVKNLKQQKSMPILGGVIGAIVSLILQFNYHELLLLIPAQALSIIIMYFSIENPDLKMLEQVEIEKDRADKANQAKTDFLSAMSHEIRTPLNAIMGFSESLKEEELSPSQLEEVNDIIDASQTLLETVNGVLDISKIEAGKIEIVNSTYNFEKVFNELVALSKARLGDDRPIEFIYHLAEDTPKFLYGDHIRVKQVILNFLTNAIKYTKSGYIDFDVKNICNKGVCRLIIKVEDSGIGIKKESINRLFDKFDRLDNENSTIEGTGLGLAITKRLVELMHGKIIVQSVYGKGSQFTIVLDQKIVNEAIAEEVVEIQEENDTINHDLSTKKVLIVDDNLMNLKVAARLLKNYNVQIEQADSGFKCLDLIGGGNTYDLILMDDMMPKMSGKETFTKLKEDSSFNIPVVILTANAISGMKEEYLEFGFNDYLAKPIEKDELNRIIKKFLDK